LKKSLSLLLTLLLLFQLAACSKTEQPTGGAANPKETVPAAAEPIPEPEEPGARPVTEPDTPPAPETEPEKSSPIPEAPLPAFSRYGRSGRIQAYLGVALYADYCTLLDALYAGAQEVTLKECSSAEDFQMLSGAVRLMFLPKDLLRDPDFLTVTPFSFDEKTRTVEIFYCWQDETLTPEELRCAGLEDYAEQLRSFQAAVEAILIECVTDTASPVENAEALFTWVSDNIRYEINRTYTPFTAIQSNLGYCSIYAEVYQFLAEEAGIECRRVSGATSMNWGDHEWNQINLGGTWYHVDTTFQAADNYAPDYFFAMTDEVCSERGHGEITAFHITQDLP